jgi:hypothetical protein
VSFIPEMTLASFKTQNMKNLLLRIFAVLILPFVLLILDADAILIDVPSILSVVIPILLSAYCLHRGAGQAWARTLLVLGVPVGLQSTTIGLIQITSSLSESQYAGASFAIALVTIFYGGIISAMGYAMGGDEILDDRETTQVLWWLSPLLVILGVSIWIMLSGGIYSIHMYLRWDACLIFVAVMISFLILRDTKPRLNRIIEASLYGSIICVALAVLKWFWESSFSDDQSIKDTLIFASVGLLYGSSIYIAAYLIAFQKRSTSDVDAGLMNWHFLEINAFLYFLIIAPTGLQESMAQKEQLIETNAKKKEIIERIERIEEQLK